MSLKKYISDSKMFEYDKHYRECTQNNQPFIKARTNPSHGLYYVQIDLMPCDHLLSQSGKESLKKLFEEEIEFVKSSRLTQSQFCDFSIDEQLSWIDGVSSIHLNSFCERLYDLSQKYKQ